MADASRTPEVQLEALRVSDFSWHSCQVSLSSSSGSLVVHFDRLDLEDDIQNVKELYARVRVRSIPLEGDDCQHIQEGEHVLAASISNYNFLFIDAMIQEVRLTRHSERTICRCKFMIKWIHQDPDNGENVTVPSSIVKKLSKESVKIHPVVAAFLNSMKNTSLSDGAYAIPDEIYGEYDVNGAIEKHIEEIGNLADVVTRELLEETGRVHPDYCEGVIGDIAVSCSKVPLTPNKGNSLRRSNRNRNKMKTEAEDHEPVIRSSLQDSAKNIFVKEDLPENISPLNPLAARAALASLVSKFHQKLDFSFYGDEKDVALESKDIAALTHVVVKSQSVNLHGDAELGDLDKDIIWGDLKNRKQVTFSAEKGEESFIHKVVLALRHDTRAEPNSSHKNHLFSHAMGSKQKEDFINDELVEKKRKLKISSADQAHKRNEGEGPWKENSTMNLKRSKSLKQQPSRSLPRLNLLPRTRSQASS
ncbi:hypothetical protein V2J09_010441 [Rumex salicifolius]